MRPPLFYLFLEVARINYDRREPCSTAIGYTEPITAPLGPLPAIRKPTSRLAAARA